MKKNMGNLDRSLRLIGAAVLILLYFLNVISGTLAIVSLVIAAMLIITSFISFCPLYLPFKISTRPKEQK
jgi:type IV secretory pathway VirB6-like protein